MKDLRRKHDIQHSKPWITAEDIRAVESVLHSGMIAQGDLVNRLEHAVAAYMSLQGGVATSNGTSALILSLSALGVGKGDEVIIPTYVCPAVWEAVVVSGGTPVLCDVGDDWCMNAETVRGCLSKRTKVIIVVHLYGIKTDVEEISDLGIPIVENCAQSFGSKDQKGLCGNAGEICVCSFHATKLLTTGEGGAALTKDSKLLSRLKELKYGETDDMRGPYPYGMTDIQAALGLSQLKRYPQFLERRRRIAKYYFEHIDQSKAVLPYSVMKRSIFHRFPLRVCGDIDRLREEFAAEGIQVRRGVDRLLHRQLGMSPNGFPGAERCFAETLSIPIYPALGNAERDTIVNVTNLILKKSRT
jgi:UDP-4-amino-4-deoxy-L-arabinose-oxoglutarate aminotransferase